MKIPFLDNRSRHGGMRRYRNWPPNWLAELVLGVRPSELGLLLKALLCVKRRTIEIDDLKFWIDPLSRYGRTLEQDGVYEASLTAIVRGVLSSGDTFVDVGANEGWFTLIAAKRTGPRGRVIAFEPQHRIGSILRENLFLNGLDWVTVSSNALGDVVKPTPARITLAPSLNSGFSSIVRAHAPVRQWLWPREDVVVLSLDSALSGYGCDRIKLVKVDVEGFEFNVLKGARSLIANRLIDNWIIETHPRPLQELGASTDDIKNLLLTNGYKKKSVFKNNWHFGL
jgi:FkbM family methyltransferase